MSDGEADVAGRVEAYPVAFLSGELAPHLGRNSRDERSRRNDRVLKHNSSGGDE
jgi:hypothetical protein